LNQRSSFEHEASTLSIVLISNGPGELTTWVRPIAEQLHQELLMKPRSKISHISLNLVLVPCPNGTGKEKQVAQKWGQFFQITSAKDFWCLLINPSKFGYWPKKGVVVFLGGDQFWSVLLAKRLKYKNITYAEWVARWPQWNDRISAMSSKVINKVPKRHKSKCKVVGDLMADLSLDSRNKDVLPNGKWIAILPGSKKTKLCVGVPFMLEVADRLKHMLPEYNFLLPIAPTTSIEEIYALGGSENPISNNYKSAINSISIGTEPLSAEKILITEQGTRIHLEERNPAHLSLNKCELAITTVGANTSELGALCIPMIVVVPTQHINVMKAWDGLPGIIVRLPFISSFFNFLLSRWRMRKNNFLAWPNILAGRMIVPEKVGKISPKDIANEAAEWLQSPNRLKGQKDDLRSLRGKPGAVKLMVKEIIDVIEILK